ADMLRDAARFAGDDIRLPDGVEQRGLAVVDMAHDRDDRRTRLGRALLVLDVEQTLLDVRFRDAADRMAHFLGDQLRGVGVDDVVDLLHLALLHQQADDIDRALRHAVGEFLDGDRLGNDHFALDLLLRLRGDLAGHALHAASERGDGTRALFLGFEGGGERQTAALLFLARLGALGLRRHDGASRHAGTAHRTRTFVLVRFLAAHGGCGLAQTLLGRGFGLFARFLFGLAALFFLA